MKRPFTAVVKQDGDWWIGWIEEVAGVNSQGKTKRELMENLRSALQEMLAFNREDALKAAVSDYSEESILV
jgi:predicted RNase H-like HicB family nuclease